MSQLSELQEAYDAGPKANPLLREFSFWLQGDGALYFDWYKMQSLCGEIWKAIFDALEDQPDWQPYLREHPAWAASDILQLAAEDEAEKSKAGKPECAPLLRKVWHVIQGFVTQETSTFFEDTKTWLGDRCIDSYMEATNESIRRFVPQTYEVKLNEDDPTGRSVILDTSKDIGKGSLLDMYKGWEFGNGKCIKAMSDELVKRTMEMADYYEGEDERNENWAKDPCWNCARCRRRRTLPHRYPNQTPIGDDY